MKLKIHIDGGSRGNPGPGGAGVVVRDDSDQPLLEAGYFLGRVTNNVAEYTALLRALDCAVQVKAGELSVYSDSELLVRQINGKYRVRNAALRPLFKAAVDTLGKFTRWRIQHVCREDNQRADELANMAMDVGEDVVALDATASIRRRRPARRQFQTKTEHVVVARCVGAPDQSVCPAPCEVGDEYTFDQSVPCGICLATAVELLQAVNHSRSTRHTVAVTCPRDGCGARFDVSSD